MKRTVFVVGAGASTDFGMPTGAGLVDRVRDLIAGEIPEMAGSIIHAAMHSVPPYLRNQTIDFGAAARDLAGGAILARSIDRFLDTRAQWPEVVWLGKCAIAAAIAGAEEQTPFANAAQSSSLWEHHYTALRNTKASWLGQLFGLLHEGIRPRRAEDVFADISFVTFNYDRLIEAYLRSAFEYVMRQTPADAFRLQESIPIHHVYGSIGPLATQTHREGFPLGVEQQDWFISQMAAGIRTFTEQHEEETLRRIRQAISQAEVIVFLGFAFDQLNVDALLPEPLSREQRFIGTCYGIGPEQEAYFNIAAKGAGATGQLYSSKCAEFVTSYEFRAELEI